MTRIAHVLYSLAALFLYSPESLLGPGTGVAEAPGRGPGALGQQARSVTVTEGTQ